MNIMPSSKSLSITTPVLSSFDDLSKLPANTNINYNIQPTYYPINHIQEDQHQRNQLQENQPYCSPYYNIYSNHQRTISYGIPLVRFANNNDVCTIPSPLTQLDTENEWKSLWYSIDELSYMKDEVRYICDQVREEQKQQVQQQCSEHNNENQMQMECNSVNESLCSNKSAIKEERDISTNQSSIMMKKKKKNHKKPLLAMNCITRGLEHRICIERQRRRYISTRYVVKLASQLQEKKKTQQQQQYNNYQYNNDNNNNNNNGKIESNHHHIIEELEEKLAKVSIKLTKWSTQLAIIEASRDYIRAYGELDYYYDNNINSNNHNNNKRSMILDSDNSMDNNDIIMNDKQRNVRSRQSKE